MKRHFGEGAPGSSLSIETVGIPPMETTELPSGSGELMSGERDMTK